MAIPKKQDTMKRRIMQVEKAEYYTKSHNVSEESEYNSLKYDLDRGIKLLPHKLKRFEELKEKLGQ